MHRLRDGKQKDDKIVIINLSLTHATIVTDTVTLPDCSMRCRSIEVLEAKECSGCLLEHAMDIESHHRLLESPYTDTLKSSCMLLYHKFTTSKKNRIQPHRFRLYLMLQAPALKYHKRFLKVKKPVTGYNLVEDYNRCPNGSVLSTALILARLPLLKKLDRISYQRFTNSRSIKFQLVYGLPTVKIFREMMERELLYQCGSFRL